MHKCYTCIICPNGCEIGVEGDLGDWQVHGAACPRGHAYVMEEMTDPKRTFSTTVRVLGGAAALVPVRLTRPIPKARLMDAVREIHRLRPVAPVCMGDVLLDHILGTDSDVMAIADVPAKETPA